MDESNSLKDWLSPRIESLQSFLESHSNTESYVRQILDKRLATIDDTTWEIVASSLTNYLGPEATDIVMYIAQADQTNRLEEVSKFVSPEAMTFLRTIVSLYGPELSKAAVVSSQLRDNWQMFYREVYYDYINKRHHIRVRLLKYNDEECTVEGDADSILELAIFMIRTFRYVPVADAFKPPLVDQFIEEANQFINFVRAPVLPKPKSETKQIE